MRLEKIEDFGEKRNGMVVEEGKEAQHIIERWHEKEINLVELKGSWGQKKYQES